MVMKTTETISRTCFAWQPTHDVPSTRIRTTWFEILRTADGSTSFNAVEDTRAARKGGKYQRMISMNEFFSNVLTQNQELGIKASESTFDSVPISTPPELLDSFFEKLAGLLEKNNRSISQKNKTEITKLAEEAYLEATTPNKPPPFTGGRPSISI